MLQLLFVSLILAFCALVQSAVGFAFNLLALPLLLTAGLSLPAAVMLATLAAAFQKIYAVGALRRSIVWRAFALLVVTSLVGLPLGVLALRHLAHLDKSTVDTCVGLMILLAMGVQWLSKVEPREHVHPAWGALAGMTSGLLAGVASIGGPPVVLYIHAHRWSNRRVRATMLAVNLPIFPLQVVLYFAAFGRGVLPATWMALYTLPAILAGTWLGLRVGHTLSERLLRRVAYGLLVFLALTLVLR